MNRKPLLLGFAILAISIARPAFAGDWLLMSHDGECAGLDILSRKLPDLPTVRTPDEFESYLKSARLGYSRKTHGNDAQSPIEFVVPSAGLSVVLVPR